MEDLKNMPLEILLDQLVFFFKEHLKMMRSGAMESDYLAIKKKLQVLTSEIESRKNDSGREANSRPPGDFISEATGGTNK